jgi:hypothetical protein
MLLRRGDPPAGRIHCCWTEPLRALGVLIGVCIGASPFWVAWAGRLGLRDSPRCVEGVREMGLGALITSLSRLHQLVVGMRAWTLMQAGLGCTWVRG